MIELLPVVPLAIIRENIMTKQNVYDELKIIMTDALLQMRTLVESGAAESVDFLSSLKVFLIGVISTAAGIGETFTEGASSWLYAEIEAAAKNGGVDIIQKKTASKNQYSVSDIAPDDYANAMNYVGQALSTTLFKAIHELPTPLRKPEMLLRGVESLLGNLLHQKFSDNAHDILDSLCEHIHMALDDLESGANSGRKPTKLRVVTD